MSQSALKCWEASPFSYFSSLSSRTDSLFPAVVVSASLERGKKEQYLEDISLLFSLALSLPHKSLSLPGRGGVSFFSWLQVHCLAIPHEWPTMCPCGEHVSDGMLQEFSWCFLPLSLSWALPCAQLERCTCVLMSSQCKGEGGLHLIMWPCSRNLGDSLPPESALWAELSSFVMEINLTKNRT